MRTASLGMSNRTSCRLENALRSRRTRAAASSRVDDSMLASPWLASTRVVGQKNTRCHMPAASRTWFPMLRLAAVLTSDTLAIVTILRKKATRTASTTVGDPIEPTSLPNDMSPWLSSCSLSNTWRKILPCACANGADQPDHAQPQQHITLHLLVLGAAH